MSKDTKSAKEQFDSIQYSIDFWEGALGFDDEIDHFVRELPRPRHVRAADDVA